MFDNELTRRKRKQRDEPRYRVQNEKGDSSDHRWLCVTSLSNSLNEKIKYLDVINRK